MVNPSNKDENVPEDNLKLRRAIYKLKLENSRMKHKLKTLSTTVRQLIEVSGKKNEIKADTIEAEKDYDEIGRDYILIGGPKDPFSIRYEIIIKDSNGIQHKSAERYYWYKKAEHFNDTQAMQKIREADSGVTAEKAMKAINGVDEKVWDEVKEAHWEEAQRLKLQQVRWIANLLVVSGTTYIAVASRDKKIGTGWNKKRDESAKPWMWDGENLGGKFLMNYREQLKETHSWLGSNEEKETQEKFYELRKSAWRRSRSSKDQPQKIRVVAKRAVRARGGTIPRKQRQTARVAHEAAVYQPLSSFSGISLGSEMPSNINYTGAYGVPAHGYAWM